MDLRLTDKIGLVTGAGQGIGRAIALSLSNEGATVAVNDIRPETAERTAQEIRDHGGRAEAFAANVADYAEVEQMVRQIVASLGRIDILVNNAGTSAPAPIQDMTLEQWHRVMDVNLNGVFYCIKATYPLMMKQRYGRIVSIASFAGKRGTLFGDNVSYSTSKSAVMGLTVSLATEAARYGIAVNAVAPGIVETDLLEALPEEKRRRLAEYPLLKRLASVDDIARIVVFLASDATGYVTGEVIDVNGGLYLDL